MTNRVAMTIAILLHVEPGYGSNDHVQAAGDLQEHTCMVREVNRLIAVNHIPHLKFTYHDRLDRQKSLEMAQIYLTWAAKHYRITDPRVLAYRWRNPKTGHPPKWYKVRVQSAYQAILRGE